LSGQYNPDSLSDVLKTHARDTDYVKTLSFMAWAVVNDHPDSSILLSKCGLELSRKLNYTMGMAQAYHNIGLFSKFKGDFEVSVENFKMALQSLEKAGDRKACVGSLVGLGNVYIDMGKYDEALSCYQKSLKIKEDLNIKTKGIEYGNIAIVYESKGEYPKALEYHFRALKNKEELGQKREIAATLGNIGIVYDDMHESKKAMEFYNKALTIAREIKDEELEANNLGNIGLLYANDKDYEKALEFYFKALKIDEARGHQPGIARHYDNIGTVYVKQKKNAEALDYLSRSLKIFTELQSDYDLLYVYSNIGGLYDQMKKYGEAEKYYLLSYNLSKKEDALGNAKDVSKNLAKMYAERLDWKKAYEYQLIHNNLKDTIFNEEKSRDIGRLEAEAEFSKQKAVTDAEHKKEIEKKEALARAESSRQKTILMFVIFIALAASVVAVFIFRSLRLTKKQKHIIEQQKELVTEKNKEILDSINYAKRIQTALLPNEKYIERKLKESAGKKHYQN
jgi:tetratricopeptide (TPR) repeat protein